MGEWMSLDAEQIVQNGIVVGTRNPTGDYLLIDCRFELPYGKRKKFISNSFFNSN